jgi:hypothetical protein
MTERATGSAGVLLLVLLPYLTITFWAAMQVVQALSALVAPSRR